MWNGILGEAGERERRDRQHDHAGVGDADLQELEERQRVELDGHDVQGRQEGDAAQQVHDNLAEGVLDGLLGTGEADEEEGAHRGDLPAGEQPQHVVREHDEEHGRQKDEHEGEERRPAVLRAFRLVRLEVFHVTESVHADAGADDADDKRHEQRQRVEVQPFGHEDVVGETELEHKRADHLDGCEHASPQVLVLNAEVQDGGSDEHADGHADVVDHRGVEIIRYPRSSQIGHEPHRR